MGKKAQVEAEPTVRELIDGIIGDAQDLIHEQFELLRVEVQEELAEAKSAAVSLGAGAGLAAVGGVFAAHMLVHVLQHTTRLPLWACYGTVGGVLGAAGVGLLNQARRTAAGVELAPPPQTAAALQENLTWVKDQLTPGPA